MRAEVEGSGDALRIWRFLRLLAIAAAGLSAAYFTVASILTSGELYATGAVVAGLALTIGASAVLARRGETGRPVLVTSYAMLVTVVLVAPFVPFGYATLALTCALAATVAIAFAEPRHTRGVIFAATIVALYASLIGLWLGQTTALPAWERELLVVLTIVAQTYLIAYAMLQLRERLTGILTARQLASAKLEEAHRTLEDAYQRVRAADRRKDDFLALLGHELRNPLSPIVLALELMRDKCDGLAVTEREIIERQVRHMKRLVDDLLDVSRITRGKLALARRTTELRMVVENAVEMTRPLLEKREQALVLDVPAHGCLVDVDPTRMAQVVSNLLSNASRYTPAKGHVAVRAAPGDGEVRLVVEDDGMGMTPEVIAHVFEPFVQGETSTDHSGGGLGLGLSLAQSLVEMHGGTITAASEGLGRGARFTMTLPLALAAIEAERAPALALTPRTHARVLVVDDNQDAADLLALALSQRGFDVRVAHEGSEALRVARELQPEIAVLDIGLPVIDGYELAGRLRDELHDHPPKLIALTGYGQPGDRERSAQAGFSAHLVKPVDLEQLERCLA